MFIGRGFFIYSLENYNEDFIIMVKVIIIIIIMKNNYYLSIMFKLWEDVFKIRNRILVSLGKVFFFF